MIPARPAPYIPIPTFRDPATGIVMTGIEPLPLVTALHVFAARRESFDVIVRRTWSAPKVIDAVFDALPLEENGWKAGNYFCRHVGNDKGRFPIWRFTRL